MEQTIEKISGSRLKITFTLNADEAARFEKRAVNHLGSELSVKGFRPGKIPSEVVKTRVSQENLNQEVMRAAVRELYPYLVKEQSLETVGAPEIKLINAAPLSFELVATILPVVDLGKWEKIKIGRQPVTVADREVEKLIDDLRDERASEAVVMHPAELGDKVDIDFELTVDKVAVEGGKQTNYQVILGQGRLMPGFEDNLIGVEVGQEKTFTIDFPANYHSSLAGRTAEVKLKLNQLFARTVPELTDEFAAALGAFNSVSDLKNKLKQNLRDEYTAREEQRVEKEMLEEMLKVAVFAELPQILIGQEAEAMVHELSHSIEAQGLNWQDYLLHLKKDEAALQNEFRPAAEKRVKLALLTRSLAKQYNLEADDNTIAAKLDTLIEHYTNNPQVVEHLQSDDYKSYLKGRLTNRRVIDWLKQKLVSKESVKDN